MQLRYSTGMSLFFNTVPYKIVSFDPSWHIPDYEENVVAFLEWSYMRRREFYCDCIFRRARWAASSSVLGDYVEKK